MLDTEAQTCHQIAVGQYLDVPPSTVPSDMTEFDAWLSTLGLYRVVVAYSRWRGPVGVLLTRSVQVPGALHATYIDPTRAHLLPRVPVIAVEMYRRYEDG